jgi:hypothetical protein
MKIHFGLIYNAGNYESPLNICDETLCGLTGEEPTVNATNNWNEVDCKKCLKLRGRYELGLKADEEAIVHQMGEMADFWEKEQSHKGEKRGI